MNIVEQKNQAASAWRRQKEEAQRTTQKLLITFDSHGTPTLKRGGVWLTESDPDGRPFRRLVGGDVLAVGHSEVQQALILVEGKFL